MELYIAADDAEAAATAAGRIAEMLRDAIDERGRALLALSGGSSPLPMYRALADEALDWSAVTVFQVDERLVPHDDPARNATAIESLLLEPTGARAELFRSDASDVDAEVARSSGVLTDVAGTPAMLDVVHLGLGTDGHTASWPPGHEVLDALDEPISVIRDFNGYDRLTLTPPVIDNAGAVVWFVSGENKREVLIRMMAGETDIPAGRVATRRQIVVSTVDRRQAT